MSEGENCRELIHDLQLREQESHSEIMAIHKALIVGEQSGLSDSSVDEIWELARKRHRAKCDLFV